MTPKSSEKEKRQHFADSDKLYDVLVKHVRTPSTITCGSKPGEDKLSRQAKERLIEHSLLLSDIESLSPTMALREHAAIAAFRRLASEKVSR